MDALVELILELIFEVLGELLFCWSGKIFDKVENSKKALKITKIIVYSVLFALLMTLLIIAIIYKKGPIIGLTLGYMILIALSYYLIFIFQTVLVTNGANVIRWILRITRYIFIIALITLGLLTLTDSTAKVLLVVGSIIGALIYIFIDAYRIRKYNKKIEKEENINYD